MEVRHWKAFLRLSGESWVDRDEEILTEFKGFAQALKRVGIDYSIVVNVVDCTKSTKGSHEHVRSTIHDSFAKMGGD